MKVQIGVAGAVLALSLAAGSPAYADTLPPPHSNVGGDSLQVPAGQVRPEAVGVIRNRKEDVKIRKNAYRVSVPASNWITTGPEGGSISTTEGVTFGATATGSYEGLGLNLGVTVTGEVGYTLNVGANKTARIRFSALETIENGTNVAQYYATPGGWGAVVWKRPYEYKFKEPGSGAYYLEYK